MVNSTNSHFDVIIIGSGPSGIFTAYEIRKKDPGAKVLMLEKGKSIEQRKCPKRKTGVCANCQPCAITTGFSGGGSFSDGKLSINSEGEIGGDLAHYIGLERFRQMLTYVDELYVEFGADLKVYGEENIDAIAAIRRNAAHAHLKLLDSRVRHMGTEKAYDIYFRIQHELDALGVQMRFDTCVDDLIVEDNPETGKKAVGVVLHDGQELYADHVVAAIGREGSEWLNRMCHKYGISSKPGPVDIGCRIETDAAITQEIKRSFFDPKFKNTPPP